MKKTLWNLELVQNHILCACVSRKFRDIPLQIEIGFLRFVERDLSCIQLNKNWGKLKKCIGIVKGCLKKKYSMAIIQYTKISYVSNRSRAGQFQL